MASDQDSGDSVGATAAISGRASSADARPSDSYLEALLDEATPGPWLADRCWLRAPHDVFMGGFGYGDQHIDEQVANAHLCAVVRQLAEEVLELRAKQ